MPTVKKIQAFIKENYGFVPKSCWIAHAKELLGLPVRQAWNRKSVGKREVPCPDERRFLAIAEILARHGVVSARTNFRRIWAAQ